MQIRSVQETWGRHSQPHLRIAYDHEVSVIVPALNEAKNIRSLITQIDEALVGRSYEVIIVDDASTDSTEALCQELALSYPVRLIVRHRAADGLSGAVLHGMAVARGESWVVMDADLQHPPQKIPELLAKLEAADFVLGSRYVEGASTEERWSRFRQWNSAIATWLARPFAGKTRDPMSGFFALQRTTYEEASQLTPLGYKIALELMCKCGVKNVAEVPIHFGQRTAGESKLSLRQQGRYLRHLSRLYAFKFPRATLLAKCAIGLFAGWAIGTVTNPLLTGPLAALAAGTLIVTTRQTTASVGRREVAEAEQVFRFADLPSSRRKVA